MTNVLMIWHALSGLKDNGDAYLMMNDNEFDEP